MDLGDCRRAEYSLEELKVLMDKATDVVNWYPHMEVEGATVRGPWNRWFRVNDIDYGKEHVSSALDDAKYAAAAMNALPDLIKKLEASQARAFSMAAAYDKEHTKLAECHKLILLCLERMEDDEAYEMLTEFCKKL